MKTLHNIFHKNLFKNYLKIFLASIASCFFLIYLSELESRNSILSFFTMIFALLAGVLPLLTIGFNNYFTKNVKFLINQHFNRLDLIKFFFYTQTLKWILTLVNLGVIGWIFSFSTKSKKEKNFLFDELLTFFSEYNGRASDYFMLFVIILGLLYICYSCFLFGNNIEELKRQNVNNTKKSKKMYKTFLCGVLALYLFEAYSIPSFILWYGFSFALCFSSFFVFNRTFKIYNANKKLKLFGFASFILCTPLLLSFFMIRSEAQNKNLEYEDRIDSVLMLEWMNEDFNEMDMLGFLKNVDSFDYEETLELFGKKVSFDISLKLINDASKAKAFIDYHSEKKSEEQVKMVIKHMANLVFSKNLDMKFIEYSESFFGPQLVSIEYIKQLYASKSRYEQFAAIYLSFKSLGRSKAKEMYRKYEIGLNFEVKNTRFVKKWMISN